MIRVWPAGFDQFLGCNPPGRRERSLGRLVGLAQQLLDAERRGAVEIEVDPGEELERAGAYRVYDDPADLLKHIDEVGVRR